MKTIYLCVPVDKTQPNRYLEELEYYRKPDGTIWAKPAVWRTKEEYDEYLKQLERVKL